VKFLPTTLVCLVLTILHLVPIWWSKLKDIEVQFDPEDPCILPEMLSADRYRGFPQDYIALDKLRQHALRCLSCRRHMHAIEQLEACNLTHARTYPLGLTERLSA